MDDKYRAAFQQQGVSPAGIASLDALAEHAAGLMAIDPDVFIAAVYEAISRKPADHKPQPSYRLAILGQHRYLVPDERS